MGTKAKPGKYDCYAAAQDDEPIFTLRARDPQAPDLVRRWAAGRHDSFTTRRGPWTEREDRKRKEAMALADAMEEWRNAQAQRDGS